MSALLRFRVVIQDHTVRAINLWARNADEAEDEALEVAETDLDQFDDIDGSMVVITCTELPDEDGAAS